MQYLLTFVGMYGPLLRSPSWRQGSADHSSWILTLYRCSALAVKVTLSFPILPILDPHAVLLVANASFPHVSAMVDMKEPQTAHARLGSQEQVHTNILFASRVSYIIMTYIRSFAVKNIGRVQSNEHLSRPLRPLEVSHGTGM
jgi:hypothetical protein